MKKISFFLSALSPRLVCSAGTGFDCASPAEIEMVRSLGVGPERIIYAHCCKMPKDIQHAASVGIQLTTFDTEAELDKARRRSAASPSPSLVHMAPSHANIAHGR